MNTAAEPLAPASRHEPGAPRAATGAATPFEVWLVRILVAASFTFCFLPANFTWGNDDFEANLSAGSLATQLEFGSIFLGGAWLAWRHPEWTLLRLRRANIFLVAFVAFALVSVAWSAYPVVTLKRATQLVGFFLVGTAISAPVGSSRQVLQVLMATLTTLLVISLIVVAVNPRVGIDTMLGNAWRGLFLQKNTTGQAAAICSLLWLRECVGSRLFPRGVCVTALLFSLFMLVMAKSSTSLLVFLIGATLYLCMRRQYVVTRMPVWAPVMAVVALVLLAVHVFYVLNGHLPGWDDIAGSIGRLFGKDSDLTGRTDIWDLVMMEVRRHPALGTGYGAFWLGLGGPSDYISRELYWIPLQSHNGYLDVINELGLAGLGIALCVFARHLLLLSRLIAIDREEGAMHFVIFVLLLIANVTESELFRGTLFYNILFFYSLCSVASQVVLQDVVEASERSAPESVARVGA
ncbi:O-antigen ligase family protein [Xylophilus sp. GOD-11R]|uniref:O-antigen ligase family protein n=1 Tax=Xylophilus sp. GOD-11R TaxID=3089814 RepID=UPI00298D2F3C|nr:O-antigen ligase family protein [Xylophilus sp. GOD-11R]WPB56113.1 O-antigen ligase family protein [Xylophilus sp. GOD-11R]